MAAGGSSASDSSSRYMAVWQLCLNCCAASGSGSQWPMRAYTACTISRNRRRASSGSACMACSGSSSSLCRIWMSGSSPCLYERNRLTRLADCSRIRCSHSRASRVRRSAMAAQ